MASAAPDDARRAIAIGPGGEVYEPDGQGSWVHRLPCTTAAPITAAGRAGASIVALGDGALYRLADNGWSAIRLVQHGKAILGDGPRALAAVGRQLFALDTLPLGEPTRLAVAPGPILAIAAGATILVATNAGAFRLTGNRFTPIAPPLAGARLVSDRWALTSAGAVDLTTGRVIAWPAGLAIGPAAASNSGFAAIATGATGVELLTITGGKLTRDPLGLTGTPVGVAIDRAGRAAVALSDGRIALRSASGWTTHDVTEAPRPAHPGPAAAPAG